MTTPDRDDSETLYRVIFRQNGETYEVFTREVGQGDLFGFVEVGALLFGERSEVVIDPSEDRLKSEFDGVRRFHLPMHSIVRIDEVSRRGSARVVAAKEGERSRVTPIPFPLIPSGRD